MKSIIRSVVEAVRDPLATKPTVSEKNAWNLADVLKSVVSAGIAFVGTLPVVAILQAVAGHPEQFGEYGPLVSAACILAIQLIRTFRQGKPDPADKEEAQPPHVPPVAGPWA